MPAHVQSSTASSTCGSRRDESLHVSSHALCLFGHELHRQVSRRLGGLAEQLFRSEERARALQPLSRRARARGRVATQRKDVAEKFMRAWLRGVRSYNDAIKDGKIAGAGADEIVATMAKSFNMNPALVREMYSQAVDVTGAVNAAGVQKDLDFFLQQGWVTGQIKASDVIDMSFAQKASAELGPYQRKSP